MTETPFRPVQNPPLLSVITTTDPETNCLPRLIEALAHLARHYHWSQEIIVVDDLKQWADRDEAGAFARAHGHPETTVRTIWYPEHRGQMPALHAGIRESAGRTILTLDPDLYPSVGAIPEMLQQWRAGYLLVHGRRRDRVNLGPIRRAGTTITNGLIRRITDLPIHDLGSPVTLFCASLKPVLDNMPADISNARLYVYSLYRQQLCEIPIDPEPAETRKSHYGIATLIPLFLNLVLQAWRIRRVTRSSHP